jgi:DNA mismatch endonuclease (patch repair protein)
MADVFDRAKRSWIMSRIKSRDTCPEVKLRKALYKEGIRGYRIHNPKIFGCPDIAFGKYKIAIFVDGCFWHGCPICNKSNPKVNEEFWRKKIIRNVERDKQTDMELRKQGWITIRIWEHDIKKSLEDSVECIRYAVKIRSNPLINDGLDDNCGPN